MGWGSAKLSFIAHCIALSSSELNLNVVGLELSHVRIIVIRNLTQLIALGLGEWTNKKLE